MGQEILIYQNLVAKGAKTYEIQVIDGVVYVAVLAEKHSTGKFVRSSKVADGKYYVSVTTNPKVAEKLIGRLDRFFPTSKPVRAATISVIILSQYNAEVNYTE